MKMHPYYQNFVLDEERLYPICREISEQGMILVMHTGFDIGFPRERIADPVRIVSVVERFPDLKFVASHCGAWELWDEVEEHMAGRNIYMDLSYALHLMDSEQARRIILKHLPMRVLFGSDSPWADQTEVIKELERLNLVSELTAKTLYDNSESLLATVSGS
jgi:predicted TIM-barrel fold metal-dependent hydrolase